MDDAEYGAALLQELVELSQDLWTARKERQVARTKLADSERDQASWKKQLDQRIAHNHALLAQELLKQQIDAKKREKVRLLKEVATAKWRHDDLQKRAGLDVSSSSTPNSDQRRHNEKIDGGGDTYNEDGCPENDPARDDWGAATMGGDTARDIANGPPSCPKSPGNSTRRKKVLRGGGTQHPRHRSAWNESCGSIEVFAVPFLATEPATAQPNPTGSFSAPSTPRSNRRRRLRNGNVSINSLRSSLEVGHGKLAALSLPIDAGGDDTPTTNREAATIHKPNSTAAQSQGSSARRGRRSNSAGAHQFNCSFSSLSTRSSSNSTTTGGTPATQQLRGRRRSGPRPIGPCRSHSGTRSRSSSGRRRGPSPSPSGGGHHSPNDASPRTTITTAAEVAGAQDPRRARSTSFDEAREVYSREEEPLSPPVRATMTRRSHSVGVSPRRRGTDEPNDNHSPEDVILDSPKRMWKGSNHPRSGPWAVDDFSSEDDEDDNDVDFCDDNCVEESECEDRGHNGGGDFSEHDLDGHCGSPTPTASVALDLPQLVSLDD